MGDSQADQRPVSFCAPRCAGRSVHVRVGPEVLQHLLPLLVVVHEVEPLTVVFALEPLLGLAEEGAVEAPGAGGPAAP